MALTVDHLALDRRIRIIRPFTDADGRTFSAGIVGWITRLELDRRTFDIHLVLRLEGGAEASMRFAAGVREGPGNGRMRDFFAVTESSRTGAPEPLPPQPVAPRAARTPAAAPALTFEPRIDDPTREEEAIARMWALAARHRFAEAREQLLAINHFPDAGGGDRPRVLAVRLAAAAAEHAWDEDDATYGWLKEWSLNLWYQWGSGATSGGEGAARAVEIRGAERAWEALERRREERLGAARRRPAP